ncbi:hypothetical protein [Desulfosporosinus orientis]|uniref:hypothetical protein n=1 Tax=Desulfosporosinus orientis TaxID=1563 RepID=UPI001FA78252|nr:hypothetical protein [Desulfosporosinus orientis]
MKTILVVDDDRDIVKLITKSLRLEQMLHQVRSLKIGVILLYVHPKYASVKNGR